MGGWDTGEAVALRVRGKGKVVEGGVGKGAVDLVVGVIGELLECVRGGVVSVVEGGLEFIGLKAHGRRVWVSGEVLEAHVGR